MKTETIRALELLYGSSKSPVCAVAADLTVLWCPDPAAETLVMLLGAELGGAETTADILPAQSDSFLLQAAQPPRICRIQTLREDGVPFYLLQFQPCPAHRGINVAEARALLSAQAAAGRQAALALMQAAHMAAADDAKSPLKQDQLVTLSCYALLNRTARCEELLWYDALETGQTAPQFGCTALEGCLTDFLSELSDACCGAVKITEQHIAEGLCAAVEPKRLHFALLLLVLNMQEQLAEYSELAFSAARTDTGACTVTLRMCAAAEEASVQAEFRQRICPDGTLLSDTALLDCFCRTFGAAYETVQEDGAFRSTLTLPPVPADHPLALCSPIRRVAGSRRTLTHVLLSDVLYLPR